MNLIHHIQYIIETDKTVRDNLNFEEDTLTDIRYPSVAYNTIPEGMQMPYLRIYDVSDYLTNESHEVRRLIRFEVVAENNNRLVKRVINRLQQLFHRRDLQPYGIVSHVENRAIVPVSKPSLFAEVLTISVRQHRQDLGDLKEALPEVYAYFTIKGGQ